MKKCISCGIELDDDAIFCGECGTKQPELQNVCSNCGAELLADARFCGECGTPVQSNPPTPQQQDIISQPLTPESAEIMVTQPDNSTISIAVNGVMFNLKLVKGRDYGTDHEIADFFIGETPVTQALWSIIMGNNPSSDNANINYPVTNITPSLATSLLVALHKLTGVKFELPAEEQWKYAYKGGVKSKGYKYAGSDDIAEIGWTDRRLHPVGQLFTNELGLADMEGNVEELLKGSNWAKISINAKDKLKTNDLSGLRVVVNVPVDDIMEKTTPLQAAIAAHQAVMIPARLSEIQERQRQEAEEARIKAEEEARRKAAEEKARAKAEEEARIKAEEAAKRKAEADAIKKAKMEASRLKAEEEARIKAEEEAKQKAEKDAKINSLKNELSALQQKDTELKNGLDALANLLQEKKGSLVRTEDTVNDCNERLSLTEKAKADLEKRFSVVLTKRVEYGFFSSKGSKFDDVLVSLTGESKEQIKEWNSTLKRDKKVTISNNLDKDEALHCKSEIDNAGGEAKVESTVSATEYETQKNEYLHACEEIRKEIKAANDLTASLKEEIDATEKQYQKAETTYLAAQLSCNKCDLEIKFLESNLPINEFLKETYPNESYRPALSELFGADYESFHKKKEKARLKAELKKKISGIVRYSQGDDAYKAYQTLFNKEIKDEDDFIKSELDDVEKLKTYEWVDFDYSYCDKKPKGTRVEFAIIREHTLVIRGNGDIPDIKDGEGVFYFKNYKHWTKLIYTISTIVFVGNITSIGARCFKNFQIIDNIILNDSIERLGVECFACNFSGFIRLSNNLKEIGEKAIKALFLKHIVLPESVRQIGKNAFSECEDLESVLVPKNCNVDPQAFSGCEKLK